MRTRNNRIFGTNKDTVATRADQLAFGPQRPHARGLAMPCIGLWITAAWGMGAACNADGGTSPFDSHGEESTGGDSSTTTTEGTGDGPRLDVAAPGADAPQAEGCQKIDFLFVIDSSASMRDKQDKLKASFPGFIEAIQNTAKGTDYHIMVVDTDAAGVCQPTDPGCPTLGTSNCDLTPDGWVCTDGACDEEDAYACAPEHFDSCDHELGAGVNNPAGRDASNQACDLLGGQRYLINGQPNLDAAFECIATVGTAGSAEEIPMEAMMAAVSHGSNAVGGCNEAFLRDDAILVVTFITDDSHTNDAGTPMDWWSAVVNAKNGDDTAIVVLGLLPQAPQCLEMPGGPAEAGDHWRQFVGLWGEHGLWASVCEDDYAPFFATAVAPIADSCENFRPPT